MSNPSEFFAFIEKRQGKRSFETAIAITRKYGNAEKETESRYKVNANHMTYVLKLNRDARTKSPYIFLESVITLHEEDEKPFFDMCFDLCSSIDPLYGIGDNGICVYDYGPAWAAVEHYRDPYFFCLDPRQSLENQRQNTVRHIADEFIYDKDALNKIAEIRKVLSLDELVNLLRKNCKKVAIGPKGGVTVWKGEEGDTASAVSLRYFLAQEVRRRGVHLEEGSAEQYAKELGIK